MKAVYTGDERCIKCLFAFTGHIGCTLGARLPKAHISE